MMPNTPLASVDPNIYLPYLPSHPTVPRISNPATHTPTDHRHQQTIITSMERLNPTSITPLSEKWKQLCMDTLSDLENLHTSSTITINNNLHFRGRECVIAFMEDRRPELRTQVADKWKHLYHDAIREFEQTVAGRVNSHSSDTRIVELQALYTDASNNLYEALAQLQESTNELAAVSAELHRVQNQLEHVQQDKVNEKWRAEHYLRKVQRLKQEGERKVVAYRQVMDEAGREMEMEKTRQRFKQQGRHAYYAALKLEVATLEGRELEHVRAKMECVMELMDENDPVL